MQDVFPIIARIDTFPGQTVQWVDTLLCSGQTVQWVDTLLCSGQWSGQNTLEQDVMRPNVEKIVEALGTHMRWEGWGEQEKLVT